MGASAGVSRGTPGYFFRTKAELYQAVLDRSLAEVRDAVREGRERALASNESAETILAGAVAEGIKVPVAPGTVTVQNIAAPVPDSVPGEAQNSTSAAVTDDLDAIDSDELPAPGLHELADAEEYAARTRWAATTSTTTSTTATHGHGHGHDEHDAHPAEDPKWVLVPLAVGIVIGIVLLVVFGFAGTANPFT